MSLRAGTHTSKQITMPDRPQINCSQNSPGNDTRERDDDEIATALPFSSCSDKLPDVRALSRNWWARKKSFIAA